MIRKTEDPGIFVFAHRGASKDYPENTIPAFKKAAEMNVDYIETDVHFTKDKEFVVIHDDTIDRITEGSGYIGDFILEELKEFDAAYNFSIDGGNTFPFRGKGITLLSLGEMLKLFPEQKFNIDLKDKNSEQVEYFIETVKKHNAFNRIIIASKYHSNLKMLRKLYPEIQTSLSVKEIFLLLLLYLSGLLFLKKSFKEAAVQIPEKWKVFKIVTRKFIEKIHEKDLEIHVWTVNYEDDMKRLIDLNVDGIMTDDPELLFKVLGK